MYLSFFEQNEYTPPKCGELSEYSDSAHNELEDVSLRCMNGSNKYITDADTTQDHFILPVLPVGGLPISQDRLDRMKLVRDRTILIILQSGTNILANMAFKINIGYTNLDTSLVRIQQILPMIVLLR